MKVVNMDFLASVLDFFLKNSLLVINRKDRKVVFSDEKMFRCQSSHTCNRNRPARAPTGMTKSDAAKMRPTQLTVGYSRF